MTAKYGGHRDGGRKRTLEEARGRKRKQEDDRGRPSQPPLKGGEWGGEDDRGEIILMVEGRDRVRWR